VFAHVHMPSLGGATGRLNSEPLGPAERRGHVVLVDFWTRTCSNWLHQEPYVRGWSQASRNDGLVVIGVHVRVLARAPDRRRPAGDGARHRPPVAFDNDYAIWSAFDNHDWPALYVVDAHGIIADHHVGEGRDATSNPSAPSSGCSGVEREFVCVEGLGVLIGVLGFPP
jgi:hypothetical protein